MKPASPTSQPTTSQIKYRDEDGLRLQTYKRFKEGVDFQPIDNDYSDALVEFIQHCRNIHKFGRPPKYADIQEFYGMTDAYWDVLKDKNQSGVKIIPDIEGFCCFAGISRETLNEWERSRPSEYSDSIKRLKNDIAAYKKQLGLRGAIPPIVFATDFNNNHGYTQRQEIAIAPNNPLGDIVDEEELKRRYLESVPEVD